ncbi:peptide-methionine (R)-S-oxide reductase MsrB [Humisphaera borealis]|uniref:Peptide methionine sulfoxide reductase MsrB n=1 Tax=Humisphaera borealis TaxID=2807512 RepID=A0A7M2X0Z1_9BACT|nr:peptide-methionine (R)-S-oxide reductase MsrB [Humisphaera borealis]QOV91355.1 peptide-methionine (R)-S-oxide reductase MsrB [Humisphaera borealis]
MRFAKWCGVGVATIAAGLGLYQLSSLAAPGSGKSDKKESAVVKVAVYDKNAKLVPVETARVVKTDEEWLKQLGPEAYKVVRAKGTERPFCGTLLDNKKEGVYACVGCGLPLFSSDAKFNSGTGWPSFFKPVAEGNVVTEIDRAYGMVREEILCGRCGGHLGHVFDDGPPPTGKRHCVNSESLKFFGKEELVKLADPAAESSATKPATQPAK